LNIPLETIEPGYFSFIVRMKPMMYRSGAPIKVM
jgi:hypothetical protein